MPCRGLRRWPPSASRGITQKSLEKQATFRGWSLPSADAVHDREVTGGGKASGKLEKFRAVNTVLGNLKTAICGTYHAFNFAKYAHRYLAEVQYRFNRRVDLSSILVRLLRAAVLTKPLPGRSLRAAELCG